MTAAATCHPEKRAMPTSTTEPAEGIEKKNILLTGATGFVGGHLRRALERGPHRIRCASRDPSRARRSAPASSWVELDVNRNADWARTLDGVDIVYYLVHAMGEGDGYAQREQAAAEILREEAVKAGVERIVYLGGVQPSGTPSEHLLSRAKTGEILRSGGVPTIELRAGMIIGEGSESWRICRDLSVRLPVMVLPKWLENKSQPIAIDDVVAALSACATLDIDGPRVFEIPGPETLTAKELLFRIQELRGTRALTLNVPLVSPRLSSHWIRLVSGANFSVARELVEGLTGDLVATGAVLWDEIDHEPMGFDRAVMLALADGKSGWRASALEAVTTSMGRAIRERFGAKRPDQ